MYTSHLPISHIYNPKYCPHSIVIFTKIDLFKYKYHLFKYKYHLYMFEERVLPISMEIYIPRILGYITRDYIKSKFLDLNLGTIIDIDMYKKINENGYHYYFAFIKLLLHDSSEAIRMYNILEERKIIHIIYNDLSQYWEVKKYVSRNRREELANKKCENNDIQNKIYGLTEQDKLDLNEEFEELEKEIFEYVHSNI